MHRRELSEDDQFKIYELSDVWTQRMLNHAFDKMYQRKLQEQWLEDELERVRKLGEKMAATKRRLLNREKLSDIQSVDNLEKLLEQEIESIPQTYMNVLEKEDEELAEAVVEEIEELDIEDLDEFSQGLEEEFEIQHLQITDGWEKRETRSIKSKKMDTKAAPVHVSVATPAMSVANRVDNAKVKTTVGAADVSAGDRTTVVMQGGQMKIADDTKDADIKIALSDVNMELGSDTRIKSVGGGMDLKALSHTVVNVKAEARTIKMEDGSKIDVHGDDLEGKYDEALVHKGAVDIQMGQGANLEIRDADDQQDLQGIVGKDNVTERRQTYQNFRHERLAFWEEPKRWLNQRRARDTFCLKFSNKIRMLDFKGQHNLQTFECICQACQHRRLVRRDAYIQQGFWPVRRGASEMIIDMDVLHLFTSLQACSQHMSQTRYLNVLRNFFKAKSETKKPGKSSYSALFKALEEFCGQKETEGSRGQ
ncbi:uncharacterized protein LOC112575852 isoform X3 [Pomacea canaliculata]|uniref:uncharacterized protein LOC112575852 isoform X3 n=1 Tax=Pomacea canaliculata TaxID=400727 RepID=UPI000D7303CD|nr:uncharacterized protein LOC112575852 isoform X3 [Pomacea canaliculata]